MWIIAGQASAFAGGIFLVRAITEILSPQQYGILALAMTFVSLCQQVVFAGPGAAAMRFYATGIESQQLPSLVKAAVKLAFKMVACSLMLFPFSIALLWLNHATVYILLACATFLFALLTNTPAIADGLQHAARNRSTVALHQGLASWLRVAGAIIIASMFGPSSTTVMYGYAASAGLILISQIYFCTKILIREKRLCKQTHHKAKELPAGWNWYSIVKEYAMPFAMWGLPCWMHAASARWAIQIFSSTDEVGLYAVLFQIGFYPIAMVSGFIVQLVTPIMFSHAGTGKDQGRRHKARKTGVLILSMVVLLAVSATMLAMKLHSQIFAILVAERYATVSYLLPALVLSSGIHLIGEVASILLMSETTSRGLLIPKICTSFAGMILTFIAVCALGLNGAILASVVTSVAYTTWVLLLVVSNASVSTQHER